MSILCHQCNILHHILTISKTNGSTILVHSCFDLKVWSSIVPETQFSGKSLIYLHVKTTHIWNINLFKASLKKYLFYTHIYLIIHPVRHSYSDSQDPFKVNNTRLRTFWLYLISFILLLLINTITMSFTLFSAPLRLLYDTDRLFQTKVCNLNSWLEGSWKIIWKLTCACSQN